MSEMLSSGGKFRGTSLEMSPLVLLEAVAAAPPTEPKSDIRGLFELSSFLSFFEDDSFFRVDFSCLAG